MSDDLWVGWEDVLKQSIPAIIEALKANPLVIIKLQRGDLTTTAPNPQQACFDRAEKQVQEWAKTND